MKRQEGWWGRSVSCFDTTGGLFESHHPLSLVRLRAFFSPPWAIWLPSIQSGSFLIMLILHWYLLIPQQKINALVVSFAFMAFFGHHADATKWESSSLHLYEVLFERGGFNTLPFHSNQQEWPEEESPCTRRKDGHNLVSTCSFCEILICADTRTLGLLNAQENAKND